MELGELAGTREQYSDIKAREVTEEEGEQVELLLKLPDGQATTKAFKMGHTVAYVKLVIEKDLGLRMDKQQLALAEGKPLIDILCLADYPQIQAGVVNAVTVSMAA